MKSFARESNPRGRSATTSRKKTGQRVHKARRVHPAHKVRKAQRVRAGQRVNKAQRVHPEHKVRKAQQVRPAHRVRKDCRASGPEGRAWARAGAARVTGTDTVRCADDEALISLVCASGATDGTKCATPGTAATGLCMRK
jgi:hypothetical protein